MNEHDLSLVKRMVEDEGLTFDLMADEYMNEVSSEEFHNLRIAFLKATQELFDFIEAY